MQKNTPRCRICFDKSEDQSRLITPCGCIGSSRYVHQHCLEQWQRVSFDSNLPQKAEACTVCQKKYSHPFFLLMFWWKLRHQWKTTTSFCSLLWISFVIIPIKIIVHALLISMMIIFPFKSIRLFGGVQLSFLGGFPPQIALTSYSDNENHHLREGMLLIATTNIPESSCFHRAVILIVKHSHEGTKGVVLNTDTTDMINTDTNTLQIGYGGPLDRHQITLLHKHSNWSDCSDKLYLHGANDSIHERTHDGGVTDHIATRGTEGCGFVYIAEENIARCIVEEVFPSAFALFHSGFPAVSALHPIQLMSNGSIQSPARLSHHHVPQRPSTSSSSSSSSTTSSFGHDPTDSSNVPSNLNLRIIRGHSFWGTGQLAGEIRDGYWTLMPTDIDAIFCAEKNSLWSHLHAIS